ncbi:unnamed protein product [Caenorhabditis bovis]|uniref:Transcription initiation factor IIA subunit 2 n=1 Tax=Caenorhabditis bovis TaxID=2654633 RepID=A0A8S1EL10_9PELO|nr:unnamed protein product [Caenorhabditis bovis]
MERPNYQLYRNTTLGQALQKTLDEFVGEQMITEGLSKRVMESFDKSFNRILSQKAKNKVTFKGERLRAYRYCDNVWTFIMDNVDCREVTDKGKVDRLKIVACDGSQKNVLPAAS